MITMRKRPARMSMRRQRKKETTAYPLPSLLVDTNT